jgi:hypothetical protein
MGAALAAATRKMNKGATVLMVKKECVDKRVYVVGYLGDTWEMPVTATEMGVVGNPYCSERKRSSYTREHPLIRVVSLARILERLELFEFGNHVAF